MKMTEFYEINGKTIAIVRVARCLTQKELGDLLGLHDTEMSRIESCKRMLPKKCYKKLEEALECPLEIFFGETDSKKLKSIEKIPKSTKDLLILASSLITDLIENLEERSLDEPINKIYYLLRKCKQEGKRKEK
jgi:transcriptional regulator with XRE-family HTH domain